MVWTPDQVIKLVGEVGAIVGSIGVITQALHNNKAIALNNSDNAHKTLMNVTSQIISPATPSSGTDTNTKG